MNPFPFAGPFFVLIAKRYRKSALSTEARPKQSQARLFVSVGETLNASFVRTGATRGHNDERRGHTLTRARQTEIDFPCNNSEAHREMT